jgi:uncharacterized protein
MIEFFDDLWGNRVLIAALTAWLVAQVAKAIIYAIINKDWKWERLLGSGGMPSSHASTICALTVAVLINYGVGSVAFAISFILAVIVIHDARGVRLEAGKQAKVLNHLLHDLRVGGLHPMTDSQLKELVGHTPLQVFVGSLLGILIGFLMA